MTNKKMPPHSLEAEMSVLGSMLQDEKAIKKADEVLASDGSDFFHAIHGEIYKGMMELHNHQTSVDLVTCCDKFKDKNTLDTLGGLPYLAELLEVTPTTANVGYHISIVKEKSNRRNIISACSNIAEASYSDTDMESISLSLQKASTGIEVTQGHKYEFISDISTEMLGELKEGGYTGIPFNMRDLDRLTGGAQRGTLTAIAGRPSQGKTTFAMDVASRQAEAGNTVGVFQLETSKKDMTKNAISRMTGINSMKFRNGRLSPDDWSLIAEKTKEFQGLNLLIDDQSYYIEDILKQIRIMYRDKKVDTVFIDYLGLILSRKTNENRNQELGSFTRRLKLLAKELDISIFILCQLNRGLENRDDKRPRLSDLRDSGEIEQDIDLAIMLFWEGKYDPKILLSQRKDTTELIINKHRNGPTGGVEMEFRKHISKFEDAEEDWE